MSEDESDSPTKIAVVNGVGIVSDSLRSGEPCLERRGTPVYPVYSSYQNGQSVQEIAQANTLSEREAEAAVQFCEVNTEICEALEELYAEKRKLITAPLTVYKCSCGETFGSEEDYADHQLSRFDTNHSIENAEYDCEIECSCGDVFGAPEQFLTHRDGWRVDDRTHTLGTVRCGLEQ